MNGLRAHWCVQKCQETKGGPSSGRTERSDRRLRCGFHSDLAIESQTKWQGAAAVVPLNHAGNVMGGVVAIQCRAIPSGLRINSALALMLLYPFTGLPDRMFDIEYRLWLLRRFSKLFLPPLAAVYTTLRFLEDSPSLFVPKSLLARIACYVISLPLYWAGWIRLSNWDNERLARTLGARLPPLIKSKKFGGLDLRERYDNNRRDPAQSC